MILSHKILIRCIFITNTLFLFSYDAYGVNHNNRSTFTSTKIDYNTSHNLSSSVKYHIKQKMCVYNEVNRRALGRITYAQASQKQYDQLHSFVLKAIHHPADCLLTHSLDQVSAIFTAASVCKDHRAIELLAGNLIKGDIKITNDTWSYMHIWKLNSAIYAYTSPSVIHLREIIASHIVNPNNDMSTWEPTGFTYVLSSLVKDSSNKEKEALQKLVAYLITKNCNIDKWGGHKLSLLLNALASTNIENTNMAIIKVLNAITKSGLSFWNTRSASTILKSLASLKQRHMTKIVNHEAYTKVLNLIMDYLVNPNLQFKDLNSITIASLMQTLWKIRSLVNSDKILIVRHKLAEAIIYQNTHMPFNSNDWMLMIRGLNYKYNVEKEAIRVLADCLNTKKIDLSECTSPQLLNILGAFSYHNGLRIEKAIQKIADFIAKENLDSWDSQELESTSELLILKTRDFHHHAINNIASQILKRSKNSLVDDHINISITLSRGRGDSCLALIRNIANEVSDDSFDISRRSPIFLAKLISILRLHEDDKYIEEAMNKIAASFRYSNAEQLLSTPTDTLKVILGGFCRHYKLKPVRRVIFDICAIVLDESTDLSDWPIETMDVLLRTLRSPYDDDIIQRAFRKIVAKLHCYDTELQKWSVQTIARVTKGVSHLRDYSSEEFVAQLAKIYMEKRDDDESTYGIMILSAICHLPIESSKIIKTAVKLASVLSNNAYSNMHKKGKLSLFWGITLLDFVVHDKWKKASSHLKTKDRIIKLTKTIPEIDQDTINQHPIFPAAWQLEFINITYFYRPHQLSHPKLLKGDNKAESDLEGNIYDLIKSSIPSLRINTNCRISQFPVDLLLSSRSMSTCLLVEADGPMHYFKGRSDKLHMLAKDRFMESVIQEKLSLKVIRINYHDAYKSKYRKQFIKKILAIFPNYTP